MGKDTSNKNKSNSRSNRPYDVSNSFVRKVASRVSGYFGGLFSTPEATSQETPDGSAPTTPDPELTDADTPSLTRVGTLDCASPVSNVTNDHSNTFKDKINFHEPIPGPSRLQERYGSVDNYKFVCDGGDSGIPSIEHSGLNKLSRLNKISDSPLSSYSGLQLNFSKYESPVLREESSRTSPGPCTFGTKFKVDLSESTPRSSAIRSNKVARLERVEAKGSSVGDDHSESSESTSGCSSLVPQADRLSQSAFILSSRRKSLALDEKLTYARQLKQSRNSLYHNRSIPVHAETPRPSRTPSFDVSAYGKPILNKSVRETMLSSPFYTGQTTYGGAAAARRSSIGTPSNTRNQIAVKPAAQPQEGINMSHTARRILAALEEFSTPLNDVKRIPTPAPPLAVKRRNVEPSFSDKSKRPALTVPTVADMLKMRRLEQIQDSTAMARQIATAKKELSPPRRSGKIVTKMKNRDKQVDDPPPPPPDLPKVSLQFTTLPKFDLPLLNTVKSTVTSSVPSFTFSSPSVPTTAAQSLHSYTPPNQFTFSPPVHVTEWLQPNKSSISSLVTPKSVAKNINMTNTPENNGTPVPAEIAKSVVLDDLGKSHAQPNPADFIKITSVRSVPTGFGNKFKPLAGSWTCDTCMIVNKPDVTSCVACETKRVDKSKSEVSDCTFSIPDHTGLKEVSPLLNSKPLSGFGDKFKPDVGSWSCDDCMVRNKGDCTKCVACSANKPGTAAKEVKPAGPWKCVVCLISCEENCAKCNLCGTSRPNGPLTTEPKFDFGLPPVGFKFGIDKAGPDIKPASNGPIPATSVKSSVPVSAGTFTFGIKEMPASEKQSVDAPIRAASSPTKKDSENSCSLLPSTTSTSTFTFGISTTSISTTLPIPPITTFPSFGLNGPLSNNVVEDKSLPTFSGPTTIAPVTSSTVVANDAITSKASLTNEQPTTVPFKFGPDSGKTLPGLFTFGAKNSAESKPFPSSSQNNVEFNFGVLTSKPLSSHTNTPATAAETSGVSASPFGAAPLIAVPNFGVQNSIPFSSSPAPFGATKTPSNTGFAFGSSSSTSTPTFGAASTPAFGAANQTTSFGTAINTTSNFGTNSPAAPSFGSTTSVATPAFGSGTPAFGIASSVPTPSFNAPVATTPSFGATSASAPTAFGSAGAPNPMFGSTSTPAFGVTSSTPFGTQSAGSSTPFGNSGQPTFGQNSAPPAFPSATPFQFGANNTGAATNLSLSVPSTFNFTGGQTPTFSADPRSVGPEPKRRIIRALRRTQK